ncbi:glycosyltransferase [bacterium]|nr:glycosyltransferase [bacterium]
MLSISFVVPAHNEAANIQDCIVAIQRAAPGAEVVVVADACTDQTAQLASQLGALVVLVEHRQIAATRNSGARAASGDTLFFVDGDTRVTPAVVQAAQAALEAGASGGGALFRFDRPVPPYALIAEKLAGLFCRLTQMSGGCILYCTRSTFDRLEGFNTRLYAGEELDFAHRVKKIGRFRVVPHAVITSGRKIRLYTGGELLAMVWRLFWKGPRALYDRNGLELWYQRREE